MTQDYGARSSTRRRGGPPLLPLGIGLAVLLVVGAFLWTWLGRQPEAVADAQAWALTGEPCPTVTAEQAAALATPLNRKFDFGGALFERGYGHSNCNTLKSAGGRGLGDVPVCEFTSPGLLKVTVGGKATHYAFQPGQPAAVEIKDNAARCVLRATQKMTQ